MSTRRRTRVLVLLVAAALVGGALVGASALGQQEGETQPSTDERTQETSYFRLVHASPDAPAVDVSLDNETVLSGVEFGGVSDYLSLPAGTYNLSITVADDPDAVVVNGTLTIEPRTVSTIVATGEVTENRTGFRLLMSSDDAYVPGENESAVSVFHLSPDAPAVDVTVRNGSTVLADNVSFREVSQYVTVPAGNYTVEVRGETETNDGPAVATANVSLAGGSAYTALAIGYADTDEAPSNESLRVSLAEDATKTVHLPAEQDREREQNQTMTAG